jgi:hypothetical protein
LLGFAIRLYERTKEMAELTRLGRNYEIMETDSGYATGVLGKRRCAIRIEYGHLKETHIAALKALQDVGRKQSECDFTVHLAVVCERCEKGLTPEGISLFILAQRRVVGDATLGRGRISGQGCPSCGNGFCYLIYDPDGCPRPKAT